jgi:hypothetical protein
MHPPTPNPHPGRRAVTPDLLGPLPAGGVSPQIGAGNNEGILMFKRDGLYYVMFGQVSERGATAGGAMPARRRLQGCR